MRTAVFSSILLALIATYSFAMWTKPPAQVVSVVLPEKSFKVAVEQENYPKYMDESSTTSTTETLVSTSSRTKEIEKKFIPDLKISAKPTNEASLITSAPPITKIEVKLEPPISVITTPKKLKWGVFAGSNPSTVKEFEKMVPENPDYLAYFVHWGNGGGEIPEWLKPVAHDKNRTLVIFWEASDYLVGGTDQPAYSYKNILAGNWDTYIKKFAKQVKDYEGEIILIPFSEWNGNWTPWSGTTNGNTPNEAVAAYQYAHGFFKGIDNVKFAIAFNAASVPGTSANSIPAYYPGSEYVDYLGVDGFNMGNPWESFSTIFDPALKTLAQYNKPLFIFSFASGAGTQKSAWLNDALNIQMPKHPLLKGFIYFNQNKERNWLLWSDQATLKVFNDYVEG